MASSITSSDIRTVPATIVATATLSVATRGTGFTDLTAEARRFVAGCAGGEGVLTLFVRHTSASLTIQENADPAVQADLLTALDCLAPQNGGWTHDTEGPDDMPAHIKTLLTATSLQVPVTGGKLALGTWQGIYLIEHRASSHRREVVLQFVGARAGEN